MSLVSYQILDGLGLGYSIAGLALVVPIVFLFRNYFRFLDHVQLLYLYALCITLKGIPANDNIFSYTLQISWVDFPHNIFQYFCMDGDLICTAGFAISFGACLLVFLLIMRIIVSIQKYRRGQIRFEPVYTFFKGFTRWVYLPLSFYSLYYFIMTLQGKADNILSSICLLAITVIFPIAQLIGYKLIQKQNDYIWRKWLQFFNFYRLGLCGWLGALGKSLAMDGFIYAIYGVLAFYLIITVWKNKFIYSTVGRIIFVIGQAIMIAIFTFFLFFPHLLQDYQADIFGVSVLLVIDIIYHIAQIVHFQKYGVPSSQKADNDDEVNPQKKQEDSFENIVKYEQQYDSYGQINGKSRNKYISNQRKVNNARKYRR